MTNSPRRHFDRIRRGIRRCRAAGTAQMPGSVTRTIYAVKHLIRWHFGPHAPLPLHPQSGRHRPPRARVRAGPERPDRRDRRRQIHPGRRGRAAGRRPGLRGAGADRRGSGRGRGHLRRRRRGASCWSAARSRRRAAAAGRSSTASSRRRAALREAAAPLVDLHGQHEHQLLLDPAAHLDLLDAFARPRGGARTRWPRLRRLAVAAPPSASGSRSTHGRTPAAPSSCSSSSPRSDAPPRSLAKTTSSSPTRQVLANADRLQRLCAEAYTALYEGDSAALPALASVWKRVGELAVDRSAVPALPRRPRRRQVPARGSCVLPALVSGGIRRVAGAAAGGRGSARGARAPQEEARADARRT